MENIKIFYEKNKVQIKKVSFILGFSIFLYVFIKYILGYVTPFFIAFIISLMVNPFVDFLEKRIKIPRSLATIISIFILILGIYTLGNSLVTQIISQGKAFSTNLPNLSNELENAINSIVLSLGKFANLIPVDMRNTFNTVLDNLIASITTGLGTLFKDGSLSLVGKIPSIFTGAILVLISLYFFIIDKKLISEVIFEKSPEWIRNNLKIIKKGVLDAVVGYVKAQGIIMSIVAIIVFIALTILGYEYALLVSIGIGIIDALPIFGSGFILWPWAGFSFITKNVKMGVGLLVIYGTIFLTRQILEPRVLGKQIGIHPLLTLISMYIGLKIFGIFGFILGPFIIIMIKSISESMDHVVSEEFNSRENSKQTEKNKVENSKLTEKIESENLNQKNKVENSKPIKKYQSNKKKSKNKKSSK